MIDELVTASAYLYSKCPGNSDNVISFKDSNRLLKQKDHGMSLMSGIKKVKELGFIEQYCTITSTIVLRNIKRDSRVEFFTPIFERAIQFSKTENVRKKRQGKSPIAVASACFYIAGILVNRKLTQKQVADMFGVVEVTVRARYQEIAPENLVAEFINDTPKNISQRVQCKACLHLGSKLPKRKISSWNYNFYHKPVYRSPGWECLGRGNVFSHIPSVTYKRICSRFEPKERALV